MLQNGSVSKPRWVVVYARVSSKEQEVEGFSIPAQLELLRDYACKQKQAFLRLVLKSAAWRNGKLQTQFEQPFENLRRSNQLSRRKDNEIGDGTSRNQIWLPESDITRT
jgi:hypothetical protein